MKLCFTTLTEVISLFWIEDSWQFCPGQILGTIKSQCWKHFKNDWEYLFLVARNDRLSLLVS